MDIYRYFETGTGDHSSTNAYLLALASYYIYPSELPPGSGSFDSKFHTHFQGLSDTDPLLCNGIINNGVEAEVMSNSRVIIVAFRGTEKSSDFEWIGLSYGNFDFKFYQTPDSWSYVRIHNGFYNALTNVSAEVINNVRTLKQQQDRPVFLTGHSRGGAFALIFAYQLLAVEKIDVAGVYVYGCPRVGDGKFLDRYKGIGLWDITFRWVNYKDPASMFPDYATIVGKNEEDKYYHVGQLNYIQSQGTITFNRENPEYEPIPNFLTTLVTSLPFIGKYHKMTTYCQLMSAELSAEQRTSVTQPVYLTKDDTGGVFPESKFDPQGTQPMSSGVCTIQQKSHGRFVDAHENEQKDFALVTRTVQNNDTQRWILRSLGNDTYTIQQKSNGRFVDAHENEQKDFALVTRTAQNNDTQRWMLTPLGNDTYTIQQKSNGRFVDAYEDEGKDFSLVTRTVQNNDTQQWLIKLL